MEDEDHGDTTSKQDSSWMSNSNDKENSTQIQPVETKDEKLSPTIIHVTQLSSQDDFTEEDTSDEGWQEAVPKNRSLASRKTNASARRPSLAKINTNALNGAENGKYRGRRPSGFSPRVSPSEVAPNAASNSVTKKLAKSSSFTSKASTPVSSNNTEKSGNAKSAPASPASSVVVKSSNSSTVPVAVQPARKALSYKEVALAAPGTLAKTIEDDSPKEKDSKEQDGLIATEPASDLTPNFSNEEKTIPSLDKTDCPVQEEKDVEKVNNEEIDTSPEVVAAPQVSKTEDEALGSKSENKEALEVSNEKASDPETISRREGISIEESNVVPSILEKSLGSVEDKVDTGKANEADSSPLEETLISPKSDSSASVEDEKEENRSENDKSLPTEGKGNEDIVRVAKEPSSKLSATAPPFNPSISPVFGSVAIPGFKEHGGILPPPVNIPPMLSVPVRKHPHQSATARVPYGPRLAGGYNNRSGHRGPRNKPLLPNCEVFADGSCFPPRVMNPNAVEFVPGQPWIPNGYTVVSPNGAPLSPHGLPPSPNSLVTSPTPLPSEVSTNSEVDDGGKDNNDKVDEESPKEKQNLEVEEPLEVKVGNVEGDLCVTPSASPSEDIVVEKEATDSSTAVMEKSKSWADYSDGEAEAVEVSS